MTAGSHRTRKANRIVSGIHVVRKRGRAASRAADGATTSAKPDRWYVYAWRGGPCILSIDGARPVIGPDLLAKAMQARSSHRVAREDVLDRIVDGYRESPEFALLATSTQRDYRRWLDRISERFGTAPVAAFEDRRMRGVIIEWRNRWAAQPRTADKAAAMMATVLGWALDQGELSINVAARIRQLHSADKSDQVWERRHARAFVAAPRHLRDALKLAALTGLRLGDLVRLPVEAVGPKAIVLVTRKRKGRAVIPVLPALRKLLDRLIDGRTTGSVLRNSRGGQWTESGLGTVFQRAKPAHFDRTIHDLRGTYVTWLAQKGLTDEEIARIVGWTAGRIAEIRARYVDERRTVVSLIERLSA